MTNTIYATKIGMTEAYVGSDRCGVTILKLLPMTLVTNKTVERDGYAATQVALGESKKKQSKSILGHLKSLKFSPLYLREVEFHAEAEPGALLDPSAVTTAGTTVNITSISKGKGLAGVVKRWHFAGGPRTHGQSDRLRRAGSIGQGTTPGRVYKGKKMSGRMGRDQVTIKNSTVLAYNPKTQLLYVKGGVAGHTGALVKLTLVLPAPKEFGHVKLTKTHQLHTIIGNEAQ